MLPCHNDGWPGEIPVIGLGLTAVIFNIFTPLISAFTHLYLGEITGFIAQTWSLESSWHTWAAQPLRPFLTFGVMYRTAVVYETNLDNLNSSGPSFTPFYKALDHLLTCWSPLVFINSGSDASCDTYNCKISEASNISLLADEQTLPTGRWAIHWFRGR